MMHDRGFARAVSRWADDIILRQLEYNVTYGRSTKMLITGEGGTGKTMSAHWLAWLHQGISLYHKIDLPMRVEYSRNLRDTLEIASGVELGKEIVNVLQDENEGLTGDESRNLIKRLDTFFTTGRISRTNIWIASTNPIPEIENYLTFSIHIWGQHRAVKGGEQVIAKCFNVGLLKRTVQDRETLEGLVHLYHPDTSNRIVAEQLEKYKTWKYSAQGELMDRGFSTGARITTNEEKQAQIVFEASKTDPEWCDESKLTKYMIKDVEGKLQLGVTQGGPLDALCKRVQKLWEHWQLEKAKRKVQGSASMPTEVAVSSQVQVNPVDQRMDHKAASTYSNRGHEAEPPLWCELLPKWLKGAQVAYVGGYGKEDGIIEHNGTTYVCDSKDYTVPLDKNIGYVKYQKLKGCFDRYKVEKDRGNNNVKIAVLFHEVNRNLWLVKQVENPLSIERDSRGRPYGSLKIQPLLTTNTL